MQYCIIKSMIDFVEAQGKMNATLCSFIKTQNRINRNCANAIICLGVASLLQLCTHRRMARDIADLKKRTKELDEIENAERE